MFPSMIQKVSNHIRSKYGKYIKFMHFGKQRKKIPRDKRNKLYGDKGEEMWMFP